MRFATLHCCLVVVLAASVTLLAQQPPPSTPPVLVDASSPPRSPETGYLHLGATATGGRSLQVNSRYLELDGKPWLPVMGEFHFSRYPPQEWEEEILKMKAAGVDIVSTYVFWIHHQETEGHFDWEGQRDLRRFVELCGRHGMYVWLRIGPWAHGEVRNGGFPDWVARLPNTRTNDPTYLGQVARFFDEIGRQVHGQWFQLGGPIIGVQLENEYGLHGPGRGAEHLLKLKQLALAAGLDAPLFSVTGWPSLDFPPHEVIPVSGGYPDGFWYGSQTNLPPSMTYLFNFNRELGDMGATAPSEDPTGRVDLNHDPYFAAEEAGGMASSYHRRPVLSADDVAALTLSGIGSGVNLYGYYMFHGGANPQGRLSSLQESSTTGYPNDLPEVSYDFGAPLGEFGQERESYRKTRVLHLFLNAFGSRLAPMPAYAPARRTRDAGDVSLPRVAVRTDGRAGFVFVNNYARQLAMPARPGFQVSIRLPQGTVSVPAQPVNVPANCYFVWPFQLALGSSLLQYSTAQLVTQVQLPRGALVTVFAAVPGIAPEFVIDSRTAKDFTVSSGTLVRRGDFISVTGMTPGINTTVQFKDAAGLPVTLLLLSSAQAEQLSVFRVSGVEHLVLSGSSIFFDGETLHLQSADSPVQEFAIFPGAAFRDLRGRPDGAWTRYTLRQPERHLDLAVRQTRQSVPRSAMKLGPVIDWRGTAVPVAPSPADFASAAQWDIRWEHPSFAGLRDALLEIRYTGDMGRLQQRCTTLDDNFFNGRPWQVGLRRYAPASVREPLTLQLLPMPASAPIYLDPHALRLLQQSTTNPQLLQIRLVPIYASDAHLLNSIGSAMP